MKKLILLFAIVLAGIRCTPDSEDIHYSSRWSVKNSTGQTLMVEPAPCGDIGPYALAAGEEINFYSRGEYTYPPYFLMIMVCWRGVPEEDIRFDVFDADGALLKSWQYEKGGRYSSSSVRNFFNQYSWTSSYDYDRRKKKKDHWMFEILQEDIR